MVIPSTLAMILAGGRVDELGVLTHYRPKSAVPFGGFARVIDFPLTNLMRSGIERIAILSQYRSYSLINHIGTGAAWDMIGRHRGISILPPFKDYENPHWYRGSADAVHQNLDFVRYHKPTEILILSGDHIYEMDYRDMIRFHNEHDADLTAAFIKVKKEDAARRFGVAEIGDEYAEGGSLLSYEEKPANPKGEWASLTVLCFKPEVLYKVLRRNQAAESYEFGRDIIPMMVQDGLKVLGYKFQGYWGYTRTVKEYWQTSMDLLGNNPLIDLEKWGLRTNLEHRDIRDCQPLKVGSQGVLDNSLAYNGCIIDGTVKNSILFPGVRVEKGAVVENSVLFFNTLVKEGGTLQQVVCDVNTTFGRNVQVGRPAIDISDSVTVIGWNNNIPDNMNIGCGCSVAPGIAEEKWPAKGLEDMEELQ
ncbi:MAG: sugar phosphate nucleotidyltransferase [Candidatus Electrothrix aestuarii]|uniref:Sugar phosphate nucleotidyltransferase n=1 Tax=Candidatus Electrothrix aestuarii TaxID=3062594 RepID=A0AAU8LNM7_9BACT|nr:sugar phosphate nucleotidyltransferase [Candidatus Electrothrix aestuarii]